MKKRNYTLLKCFLWIFLILNLSCKTREINYITYYQKVNEIDSIYRLAEQPKKAVKQYKKLFRKYEPKNQLRIEEYLTYIQLADEYQMNFGGERSLKKLIPLLAPYAHHGSLKRNYALFQKYGMDSLAVKKEFIRWQNGLNQELIDSFSIAMDRYRMSYEGGFDTELFKINNNKNFQLFKWTFEKHGFPSTQKIGLKANDGSQLDTSIILQHLSNIDEYEYLKNKLLEYVKSGDCPPDDYATMIDRHEEFAKKKTVTYGKYFGYNEVEDTILVNKNRKSIGLPNLKHALLIAKDFWKKMEEK